MKRCPWGKWQHELRTTSACSEFRLLCLTPGCWHPRDGHGMVDGQHVGNHGALLQKEIMLELTPYPGTMAPVLAVCLFRRAPSHLDPLPPRNKLHLLYAQSFVLGSSCSF